MLALHKLTLSQLHELLFQQERIATCRHGRFGQAWGRRACQIYISRKCSSAADAPHFHPRDRMEGPQRLFVTSGVSQ